MPKPATNSESEVLSQTRLDSLSAEAYGSLRFNIECSVFGREAKTITITSSGRGEGKTTTSIHLAMAYAQIGKKVMLLDADSAWCRPALAPRSGARPRLSDVGTAGASSPSPPSPFRLPPQQHHRSATTAWWSPNQTGITPPASVTATMANAKMVIRMRLMSFPPCRCPPST